MKLKRRRRPANRLPGLLQGFSWAVAPNVPTGGVSRMRMIARAALCSMLHPKALHRWMAVVFEMKSAGYIRDIQAEYLRAVRPAVHRLVGVEERVNQLIDHVDWIETALTASAFERLSRGEALVLVDLPPPGGHDALQVQLRRAPPHSTEGDLLLTLTLLPAPGPNSDASPVDISVLACSRFRVQGTACLVIGGVRGQRSGHGTLSGDDVRRMLYGWRPPIFLVRVAQELARYWELHLVGLDPEFHRLTRWDYSWSKHYAKAARRITGNYKVLWDHFGASPGPKGWIVLPLNADEGLDATSASPERRTRQALRADYWIRTSRTLRENFKRKLRRPGKVVEESRVTHHMGLDGHFGFEHSEDMVPSRVLDTGPGVLG